MHSPVIYSITHDILGDPFWSVYNRGVEDASKSFECTVEIFRPERYSPEHMRALIENVAQQRPDGLLCTIPNAEVLDGPLRSVIAAGVPVVAANARDPREPEQRIPYLLFIGGDDRNGGRLAGRHLLATGSCGNVICFDHYLVEQSCHADRFSGLSEIITQHGGSCRRIAIAGDHPDAATAQVRNILEENSAIDAVVTLGPPGAHAVLHAMTGFARPVQHVTFDFSDEQLVALKDRRLLAIIDSQQYLQGFMGIQILNQYLRYGLLPTCDIFTGPALVDEATLAKVEYGFQSGVR